MKVAVLLVGVARMDAIIDGYGAYILYVASSYY